MKSIPTLLAALALSGLAQTLGQAQTPALTSTSSGGERTYGGSIGFEFTLDADETLHSLGRFDIDSTDNTAQEVGLFDLSGNLLASASVGGSAGTAGQYVFSTDLTDANGFTGTLLANTHYILGTSGAESFYDDGLTSPTTSPGVTLVASRYSGASGFAFPDATDHTVGPANGGLAYTGPNFQFGALAVSAPEPSTYALMLGGLALILVSRRTLFRS